MADGAALKPRIELGQYRGRPGGVRDAATLAVRLSELAEQLAVETPDGEELLKHARDQDDNVATAVL